MGKKKECEAQYATERVRFCVCVCAVATHQSDPEKQRDYHFLYTSVKDWITRTQRAYYSNLFNTEHAEILFHFRLFLFDVLSCYVRF